MNTHKKSWQPRCVDGFLFQRKGAKARRRKDTEVGQKVVGTIANTATAETTLSVLSAPLRLRVFALKARDVSGLMTARARWLPLVTLLFLLASFCRAEDSRSPYATWPNEGMRPAADREAQLAEIHPTQAQWINATYAGYGYRDEAHCRAGCPECIHARALPSDTGRYHGYLVGGGAAFRGDAPYLDEGTWGWDYSGHFFRKHVALNWSRKRYQAGGGQYHTDGPKLRHE
jgi:hypothetical protein